MLCSVASAFADVFGEHPDRRSAFSSSATSSTVIEATRRAAKAGSVGARADSGAPPASGRAARRRSPWPRNVQATSPPRCRTAGAGTPGLGPPRSRRLARRAPSAPRRGRTQRCGSQPAGAATADRVPAVRLPVDAALDANATRARRERDTRMPFPLPPLAGPAVRARSEGRVDRKLTTRVALPTWPPRQSRKCSTTRDFRWS